MAQIEKLDLGRLMAADENLANIPPEQIILRWFNYHLKNAGHHRMVSNFTEDIKVCLSFFFLFLLLFSFSKLTFVHTWRK